MEEKKEGVRLIKSVVLAEYGGYDNIKVQPWPQISAVGDDEVEVAVHSCGLNFADLYTRQGVIQERSPPFVLGLECSGRVTAVGGRVTRFKPGDRVVCYQYTGGLYRETVIVPSAYCFLLPSFVSYEHGAALLANYLTAYFCLLDIGHLRAGQKVLVHSCAGGVGWAATQLAHSVGDGVTVFGTASAKKHEAARENGVTHPLHPHNYEQELKALSPQGVDIIIDNLAGANFTISQRLLKPLGRVILTGINSVVSGEEKFGLWAFLKMWWSTKSVSPVELVTKNRVVAGIHLGALLEDDPERVQNAVNRLFSLYQQKKILPRIHSVWPFEQVVEATRLLAERKNIGKVLLKVETGPA